MPGGPRPHPATSGLEEGRRHRSGEEAPLHPPSRMTLVLHPKCLLEVVLVASAVCGGDDA